METGQIIGYIPYASREKEYRRDAPWVESLAREVVLQAVNDYKDAKKIISKYSDVDNLLAIYERYKKLCGQVKEDRRHQKKLKAFTKYITKLTKAMKKAEECEEFFRSDWFSFFTNLDGEYLIEQLNLEFADWVPSAKDINLQRQFTI